jgi:TRAP-type C4-dicarboxylate transport system permease small subunit
MTSDADSTTPKTTRAGPLDRLITAIAIGGGVLSVATALLVVISVLGRWLFSSPVEGDFEFVKMATAVSVFCFLPYTQIRRGNIMVDTFTGWLPAGAQRALDVLGDLLFAAIMAVLTYCLILGTRDFINTGETTMMRGLVLWPAILTCTLLCGLTVVSALITATRLIRGQS